MPTTNLQEGLLVEHCRWVRRAAACCRDDRRNLLPFLPQRLLPRARFLRKNVDIGCCVLITEAVARLCGCSLQLQPPTLCSFCTSESTAQQPPH